MNTIEENCDNVFNNNNDLDDIHNSLKLYIDYNNRLVFSYNRDDKISLFKSLNN